MLSSTESGDSRRFLSRDQGEAVHGEASPSDEQHH